MANPRKQEFVDDHSDRSNDEDFADVSDSSSVSPLSLSSSVTETSSDESGRVLQQNDGPRSNTGLTERLTDVLVDDGDGDLLLQGSDREDRVLQWLQALDMQVMGACRVAERLKPLLKSNSSSGPAEDRLLAHLSQHFEPSEVGMLARCLCIPLVSIRVGEINKQGTLLCPSATRGNLSLTLLPTSDLRLSFIGDDGHTERLFTFSRKSSSPVVIEEMSADNTGRSFLIKMPDARVLYYWCSEKSRLLGVELLSKMKDLIERKPSIAELTGISDSRLSCFATHLRVYLMGSAVGNTRASCSGSYFPLADATSDMCDMSQSAQFSCMSSKSLRSRHSGSQAVKTNAVYQSSLSPRSSSFKEGMPRNLRVAVREKLRRRGENHLSAVDDLLVASPITTNSSTFVQTENEKLPDVKSCPFSSSFLESLGKLSVPPSVSLGSHVPSVGAPLFSPYYCWCPPGASTVQHPMAPPQCPTSSIELPSLPPLSSLLPVSGSSLFTPTPPLSLADIPSLDFPPLLPDPLVRLPVPSSQQIPTFTPLMCDPIVHIPVIDICSSGQGYLVSAGATISTTIPPLHPNLVNAGLPENESLVDKGARETLRLLISSSSQTNPPLMDVFPAVLTKADEKCSILVTGSRGLYSGTRDVDAIADSMVVMNLVTDSTPSIRDSVVKVCCNNNNLDALPEKSSGLGKSCAESKGSHLSNLREESTDL